MRTLIEQIKNEQRENVLIISGRTGSGKTTKGLALAIEKSGEKGEILVLSQEHSKEAIASYLSLIDKSISLDRFTVLETMPKDLDRFSVILLDTTTKNALEEALKNLRSDKFLIVVVQEIINLKNYKTRYHSTAQHFEI